MHFVLFHVISNGMFKSNIQDKNFEWNSTCFCLSESDEDSDHGAHACKKKAGYGSCILVAVLTATRDRDNILQWNESPTSIGNEILEGFLSSSSSVKIMRQPFCSERLPLILCFKSLCTTTVVWEKVRHCHYARW